LPKKLQSPPRTPSSHPKLSSNDLKPRRAQTGNHHAEAWDITPMVDVVFLLLIFFMLTASFSVQKVIRTGRQQSEQPSSNPVSTPKDAEMEGPIIQVDEFDGYVLVTSDDRKECSSKQDLIVALSNVKQVSLAESDLVTVQAHEESTHGAVVGALDAGRAAKYTRFKTVMVEQLE
jgi:biopolymer transport protein ExbD